MPRYIFDDTAYEQEIRLEREARVEGASRYHRRVAKTVKRRAGGGLAGIDKMLAHWYQPFRNLIAAEKKACAMGKLGVGRSKYGPVLLTIPSERLVMTALQTTLSELLAEPGGSLGVVRVALAIARGLNADANFRDIRKQFNASHKAHKATGADPKMHRCLIWETLTHTQRRGITAANTRKVAARFSPDARWPIATQLRLGTCCLELLLRVTTLGGDGEPFRPALIRKKQWHKNHARWEVQLTEEAKLLIAKTHDHRALLGPRFLPMVVPPCIWTPSAMGGYIELPTHLVKRAARQRETMENETVLEALNDINSTPWRVNRFILGVAQQLGQTEGELAGLPRLAPIPFPPRPAKDSPDLKSWKHKAALLIERNRQVASYVTVFRQKMDIATRLAEQPKLWFPHNLDFRGRQYPIPMGLNHQGDDLCRGLLECAEPVDASGHRGQFWLAVHMANCCGWDKLPFAERVAWTRANMDAFAGWVAAPLKNTGWMETDDPFQALATAKALTDPQAAAHLPVGIDGTNNALQHYAAMLRCQHAAAMVNVLPADRPADFYALVKDRVVEQVEIDAAKGHQSAQVLAGSIERSIVKQTAMTNYYGVTDIGARRQTYQALKKAGCLEQELYPASKYLSKVVLRATEGQCPSVQAALAWLRSSAERIVKSGKRVCWRTPLDMLVEQPYQNMREVQICTHFGSLVVSKEGVKLPPAMDQQVNGCAPNFVHSIDAANIMAAAIMCFDHSPRIRFAAVHDKAIGHAADMDIIGGYMAEQFCCLHEQPLLNDLAAQWADRYPTVKLDPPPPLGTLDVSLARQSTYLFS